MLGQSDEIWRPYVELAEKASSTEALIQKVRGADNLAPEQLNDLLGELFYFGRPGVMAALVAKGADPNAYDDEGCTPLNYCIDSASSSTGPLFSFIELLSVGADPNLPLQQRSSSPLHLAIARNLPGFAAVLLAFGADPTLEEPDTPISTTLQAAQFWEEQHGVRWPGQLLARFRPKI